MDTSYYSLYMLNNKYLNQQIQKKFKNSHKNKNKKKLKHIKLKKGKSKAYNFSTNKSKSFNKQLLQQQCIELKYKPSNTVTINGYTKPNPNSEPPHIITHTDYYDLKQLLKYTKKKKRNRNTNKTSKNNTKRINKYKLYDAKYLLSNNNCKWMKLPNGKFFNSSFYIFNRDDDIHSIEIVKREQHQNVHCISYFLQNLVDEIYPNSYIVLSQDIACVIGEFCRGYLTQKCYNTKCSKNINFFYEDRYNESNTYFCLSHNFEINNIIYCSNCFSDENICVWNKCECGQTDFNHQFNKYLCYNYNENQSETMISIDEFKCECNGHKLRCSRHVKCKQCGLSPCNECELFGWNINKNGLCLKCDGKHNVIECEGCFHIFNENKMNKCILCKLSYCNGIKWKELNINKQKLRLKYDKYLSGYECECNGWKETYFDAAHNLWYPLYSKWKRRMELNTMDNKCNIDQKIKCIECDKLFVVCNQCDVFDEDKFIVCNKCWTNKKKECNLCNTKFIECYDVDIDNIICDGKKKEKLNNMIKRECIECDKWYHICSKCYDGNYGEFFGLFLCLKCKEKNKRHCMYCNNDYINHILWDKIMGNKSDKFAYFMDDIKCKNKKSKCYINDICNACYGLNEGECFKCLNDAICTQCNERIINYHNNGYQSLCCLCFNQDSFLLKRNNCFSSNLIDKKWKNSHSQKKRNGNFNKKKQRRSGLNRDGKFIYNIEYNGKNKYELGAVGICSKWKKYKKSRNKRRWLTK